MRFKLNDQAVHLGPQLLQGVKRKLMHAPANSKVKQFVLLSRQHHQVFWAIVKASAIAVVNVFISAKWTTEQLFHDKAVLSASFTVNGVGAIAAVNGSGLVGAPQIVRIEQLIWAAFDALGVLHAKRPKLFIKSYPLTRDALTSGYIADGWEWRAVGKPWTALSRHCAVYFNIGVTA